MTDEQRLKFLQLLDATELETIPTKFLIPATDSEIYLSTGYQSTLEVYNIPYKQIEHEGKPYLAISRDNYIPKDKTNFNLGGHFSFSNKPTFLVRV